jgi:hypothetical protein
VPKKTDKIIPIQQVEGLIYLIRGQKVMLDSDLAALYTVATKVLNQAVRRNRERFPEDFMFQLSEEEFELFLRSQIPTSSNNPSQSVTSSEPDFEKPGKNDDFGQSNWSQFVTSSKKHRGLTYRPYVFTEQGIAMLSGVLRSPRAVQVNIEIMRAFVKIRQWLSSNADLSRRVAALEKKYDAQFKVVFDAIRMLMETPVPPQPAKEIGFHTRQKPENRNKLSRVLA